MVVKQMFEILNDLYKEKIGLNGMKPVEDDTETEADETYSPTIDLKSCVGMGVAIADAIGYDNLNGALIDRIGRTIFVNRTYVSAFPDITREAWEYGSILQKIRPAIPEATVNETWGLSAGDTPNQFEFQPLTTEAAYWNVKNTFETWVSFGEEQLKEALTSGTQLQSYFSMIENAIRTAITARNEANTSIAICNFIASKFAAGSGCINLLTRYNTETNHSLTATAALNDKDFLRYMTMTINSYKKRLNTLSTLFNVGNIPTFTPNDRMRFYILDEVQQRIDSVLQSMTFHNELTAIADYQTVPYWQGSGEAFDIEDTSTIDVVTSDGDTERLTYVVALLCDWDAIAINNANYRVKTAYNARGEFMNYFHKYDYSLFNDLRENGVIFYLAET